MEKKGTLLYWLLIIVISSLNLIPAKAGSGDYGAWNLTTDHNGMNCGNLNFTEKELAVEFWIYIDEQDGKNTDGTAIISNRHDGNYGFTVSLNKNTNNQNKIDLRFWFKTVNDAIYAMWIPRENLSNKWNHIAFIISSKEKKASVYLNTELFSTIDNFNGDWKGNIKADGSNVGNLWLASWYTSPKLNGKLTDFRVWNKVRSIDDIRADYKEVLTGTEPGLQKYYTFDNEIFAQKPVKLVIENDHLTWTAEGESWEVEVRSLIDNSVLKSETVYEKSYSLVGLAPNSIVYVRTFNNGFYSGWAFKSDIIKVGCVGDSNTYGAEATDRSQYAWPVQIRSMLGNKYETRNFGVNGALMMNHLNDAWKNKTAYSDNKSYDPDIIVIALGTNDSKDGYWDAVKFKNSYIDLIDEFKNYSAEPEIYMAIPIKAYSKSWSINDQTIREQVIPTMKEISKEKGLPLIDLYSVTNNIANLMATDGIHPRDEGLRIMARKIADIMQLKKPVVETNSSTSTTIYADYYWYKDNTLISGANAKSYTATEIGNYKVAIKLTNTTEDVIVSEPIVVNQANTVLYAKGDYPTSVGSTRKSDNLTAISSFNYIQVTNGLGATLSLYDIGGRHIKDVRLTSEIELINTSSLPKGLYLCKIQKHDSVVTTKILK
ncbi:MAG: GDSL-type esterase/lipase family protein [Bacteroidales bacterium]|nr:GDSL-type esterase/lipase family protein [Bacteroidales bacterium]